MATATRMSFYNTILTLACDRYNAAREFDLGVARKANRIAYCTEQIMLTVCSDIEDGIYSEDNEDELKRVAEFVADGRGFSLKEVGL